MAINERLIDTAVVSGCSAEPPEEGLILHLDANDVDSYDGDGDEWVDITNHEYTPTTNVSEHFNTVLFPANNGNKTVTGVGFSPDLVWLKSKTNAYNHSLYDTVRGVNKLLQSNTTNAESSVTNALNSFELDGFILGSGENSNAGSGNSVAWCFKAGGAPSGSDKVSIDGTSYSTMTAAGLTDGSADIVKLSINKDLGFSIAKYTGSGTASATVAHGLDTPPEMLIVKRLEDSEDWAVYHKGAESPPEDYVLILNETYAAGDNATRWNDTAPTSTVFTVGSSQAVNAAEEYIAYSFTSKRGVSKVGSYTGTGSSGNKVYTGFEPAFIMTKRSSTSGDDWNIIDNVRDTDTNKNAYLKANTSGIEVDSSSSITFNRDGFTLNGGSFNTSSQNHIYYAIAKNTNETSLIAPGTNLKLHLDADSFPQYGEAGYSNTPTTWTALTGSNGTITGATFDSELGNWLDFDGSNDFVATNHTQGTSTSFTFESWININNTTGRKSIIGDVNSGGVDTTTRFFFEVNGDKLRTTIGNGVTSNTHSSTTSLSANTWHHVSATISGTSVKFYVDGTHTDTFTLSFSFGTAGAQTYTIGAPGDFRASHLMDGQIGQVRMYDAALSGLRHNTELQLH